MECEICDKEMEIVTTTTDYHDPSSSNGHGQYETKIWHCDRCNYEQPYIEEHE